MKGKQTIIILHGWGLSGDRFDGLSREFSNLGYRVYHPDLPGFGKSPIPGKAYYLSDYAEFVYSFIRENSITKPILIGHSFGGRVSLKFNMLYPGEAKALILTGTPGYTPVPRRRLVVFIALAKIGKFIFSVWPLSIIHTGIRSWYYYLVGARDFYRAEGVMREIFKHIVAEKLDDTLTAVRVPCALIWGSEDRITPVWIAEKMHTVIRHSELTVLDSCDHGVSYKSPARFAQVAVKFIESL